MKRAFTAAVALTWAFAGIAMADPPTATVPIEPAPTPSTPPTHVTSPVAAPMPDARSLSQINPTAGPALPPKKALKPHKAPAVASSAAEQRREIVALNDLAAAGYGQFHDVHRVGRNYQATIDDPRGSYVITINPDGGRIAPSSAAADRETRALNLLADRGYLQVNAIRPVGTGFVANVTRNGRPHEIAVDPDSGRIARGD